MRCDVTVNLEKPNAFMPHLIIAQSNPISSLRVVVAGTQAPVTMFLYHRGHQTVLTWVDRPRLVTFRLMSVLRYELHERAHRLLAVNRAFLLDAPMMWREDRRSIYIFPGGEVGRLPRCVSGTA